NNRHTKDLLQLGASAVIITSEAPLYETVMELTNGLGAYAAIDSVGGLSGTDLAFCLQPNGKFLTIGLLSGQQVKWKKLKIKQKQTLISSIYDIGSKMSE